MKLSQRFFPVAIFIIMATRPTMAEGQEAFVMASLNNSVACERLPENNTCQIHHDVVSLGSEIRQDTLSTTSSTLHALQHYNASDECVSNTRKTLCSGFLKCPAKGEKIDPDLEGLEKSCNESRKTCPERFVEDFPTLDCANILHLQKLMGRLARPLCSPVKKSLDPYCNITGYKVPVFSEKSSVFKLPSEMEQKLPADCYASVKEVFCYENTPMCSDDGTKIISLISKQDCVSKLKCLNDKFEEGDLTKVLNGMCSHLPDASTAEKYARPENLVVPDWKAEGKEKTVKKKSKGLKVSMRSPWHRRKSD